MPGKKFERKGDFFDVVYEITKLIPYGRVTSYGAIARYLGSGRSARVVGWALNGCSSQSELIPAHRVVNKNGALTGKRYFGGSTMAQLLTS
jgi:methylated-DNA-protein-cysteine methyltransferase-like protein